MKRSRGFTLPEVLATMVLVGVVLPVAMRGITVAMQTSAHARRSAEAAELAQRKLNELVLMGDSSLFTSSGTFGNEWPGYRWDSNFTTGQFGVYIVNLNVYWPERLSEQSFTLSTMVYIAGTATGTPSTGVTP